MKINVRNVVLLLILLGAEAWLLQDINKGGAEWDSVLGFLTALSAFLANEPIARHFGWDSQQLPHDKKLFDEILLALPMEPTVLMLKEHDFGDSFWKVRVDPLHHFVALWGGVDKEFIDKALEKRRKTLHAAAAGLAQELAARTVPVGVGDKASVYSDRQRAEGRRSEAVLEDARVLNKQAREFIPVYEDFVRYGRKRLAML